MKVAVGLVGKNVVKVEVSGDVVEEIGFYK